MTGLQLTFAIVLIVLALALIVVILMQKNREADASAVQGNSNMNDNNFFDKTGGHAKDDTLSKITKVIGVLFFVVALAATMVILFVK